jgi:hypothetical protein
MMGSAYSTPLARLHQPEELAVAEGRRPACFPLHAQFARPCFPVKKGTRESREDLHRHCRECGRCYDCADRSLESCPSPFDRRASVLARIM